MTQTPGPGNTSWSERTVDSLLGVYLPSSCPSPTYGSDSGTSWAPPRRTRKTGPGAQRHTPVTQSFLHVCVSGTSSDPQVYSEGVCSGPTVVRSEAPCPLSVTHTRVSVKVGGDEPPGTPPPVEGPRDLRGAYCPYRPTSTTSSPPDPVGWFGVHRGSGTPSKRS